MMKLETYVILAVLAATDVLGQLQDLPQCGSNCLTRAILNSTCTPNDTPCICENSALKNQTQQCVLSSCTVREQLTTLNITNAECGIFSGQDRSWLPPLLFFIILATVVFMLRVVSRVVCQMKFWWDDFANLLATLGCIIFSALIVEAGNLGLGTQSWAVPQEDITRLIALTYIEFLIYNFVEVALRTSVLLFYMRVFSNGQGLRRIFLATLIISNILSVGFFLFNTFQCTPVSFFWLGWDKQHAGHCIPPDKVALSGAIIDLFWTILIILLPLPTILRLKLPGYKKFVTTVMFTFGISTITIMGYRFTTFAAYSTSDNPTISGVEISLWSAIELDVALICACLPSVYPLFLRVIHRGHTSPVNTPPALATITIGGSNKKMGQMKRRDLWSTSRTTDPGLEETSSAVKRGQYMELDEVPTH
ncbi:CFEM domain-containing protein [Nemania diffusa]|nr:CFEM domain-containing protein [Nemania diffusa]